MQEIGEQLDSAILAYAILLQLMHCSIASCVLHIAYCISHVACCVGVRSPLHNQSWSSLICIQKFNIEALIYCFEEKNQKCIE